ncbi:MAG: alpha-amylase family glycosyl hydrolase [Terriglobales bacterium]
MHQSVSASKRISHAIPFLIVVLAFVAHTLLAQDFKKQVIYQIVTDRFYNGDTTNDNPPQSSGLFDSTMTNWHLYWGGDLAGIKQKLSYLQSLGVTAIWISPPVDNLNLNIPDSNNNPTASYHGYGARDFMRIEEHFGDSANDWTAFDALVSAAHTDGIKIIVDFAPNHSNPDNGGEYGSLYNNGTFMAACNNDSGGIFHHNPDIADFDDRYQLQYYTLEDLCDLNQENSTVDSYLKAAVQQFQQHGVDAFRIDAVKHVTWGWEYSMSNAAFTYGGSFFFGEWAQGWGDALYHDSYKFANKSGISVLDFNVNQAVRDVFASNNNFSELDNVVNTEDSNFTWQNDLVTFVDSHDVPRLLSVNNNNNRLIEAQSYVLTTRGIPVVYYGDEQYIHNDTGGGSDPYNRNEMSGWSTSTTLFKVINKLASLRAGTNDALAYGSYTQRWINDDVYIYERKFFNDVVLVAIKKNDTTGYSVTGLNTGLPSGNYTDYLGGLMSGPGITVTTGSGGNNPVTGFTMPAHSVSVWQYTSTATAPEVGSIGPTLGQSGVKVTIAGKDFGSSTGSVLVGSTAATINSWSSTSVTFTVPSVTNGVYSVTLKNSSGTAANTIQFTVLTAKLIPITFTVNNATPTSTGDYIFLSGSTIELGNWGTTWDTAIGPMLDPNYPNWFLNASMPAGTNIQFKFLKIAADGTVTWENGSNHTYTVPSSGEGYVNVNWQY